MVNQIELEKFKFTTEETKVEKTYLRSNKSKGRSEGNLRETPTLLDVNILTIFLRNLCIGIQATLRENEKTRKVRERNR